MLAIFRCEEILSAAFHEFTEALEDMKSSLNGKDPIVKFAERSESVVSKYLAQYDEQSKRYSKEIVAKKRNDLIEKMGDSLFKLFQKQAKAYLDLYHNKFDTSIKAKINDKELTPNFNNEVNSLKATILRDFNTKLKECSTPTLEQLFKWDHESFVQQLTQIIELRITQERENQLSLLFNKEQKSIERDIASTLFSLLDKSDQKFWPVLRTKYQSISNSSRTKFESVLRDDFDMTNEEIQSYQQRISDVLDNSLRSTLRSKATTAVRLMDERFEKTFSYDENGVPIRWSPGTPIVDKYVHAKFEAEKLLDEISVIRLQESDDEFSFFNFQDKNAEIKSERVPEHLEILSLEEVSDSLNTFRTHAKALLEKAQKEMENISTRTSIPWYIILLILFLGFDEFIAVLKNPFLLIFVVFFGGAFYIAYMLGLFPILKPIFDSAFGTGFALAKNWAAQKVAGPQTQTPKTKTE
eukprot:TRINITY_DN5509_c0_g1_i1.p1 TRINITY_DN5509_c0_g1~~TRINITY_DN5509_c0_g1_i1.p1  ORF type:complete len:468 (+),score=107.22 TRINITY_DN5509_c0_g1_i1:843-2246(+)